MTGKQHKCSSCRRGENDEPADVYATGRYEGRPFQGYLCGAHAEMMEEDGAVLKIRVIRENNFYR